MIQHQTQAKLREEIQSLRGQMAQLQTENQGLSNRVARAKKPREPDQDWISYIDREKSYGEEAAMRWVVSKYGPKY